MAHTSSSEDESDVEDIHDTKTSSKNEVYKVVENKDVNDDEMEEVDEELIDLAPKGDETVDIEFSFCDPSSEDYLMIRTLLINGSSSLVPAVNVSSLAEDVSEQSAVGSTVKVDGEVYGFLSALCAKYYSKKDYFSEVIKSLMNECPENIINDVEKITKSNNFAWLVDERLVNLPHQLVKPLSESLLDDISWAKENIEETGGSEDMFKFDHYMAILPYHIEGDLDVEDVFDSDSEDSSTEDNKEDEKKRKLPVTDKSKKKVKIDHSAPQFSYHDHDILYATSDFKFPIKLQTPEVLVDKAKGAVPQRHRPRFAYVCFINSGDFQKAVSKM